MPHVARRVAYIHEDAEPLHESYLVLNDLLGVKTQIKPTFLARASRDDVQRLLSDDFDQVVVSPNLHVDLDRLATFRPGPATELGDGSVLTRSVEGYERHLPETTAIHLAIGSARGAQKEPLTVIAGDPDSLETRAAILCCRSWRKIERLFLLPPKDWKGNAPLPAPNPHDEADLLICTPDGTHKKDYGHIPHPVAHRSTVIDTVPRNVRDAGNVTFEKTCRFTTLDFYRPWVMYCCWNALQYAGRHTPRNADEIGNVPSLGNKAGDFLARSAAILRRHWASDEAQTA